jgi:hypothetical protein
MAINTSNLVVKSQEPVESPKQESSKKPVITDETINRVKGTKLVVDGKVKNISKKSAFLLDMLSLDDE